MALIQSAEHASIGLYDESWKALSSDEAGSLLRVLTLPTAEDRIYSSVSLHPTADGSTLYVKPN